MGGDVPAVIMGHIASDQLRFEVHQYLYLTGSQLHQQYCQVSQLHDSLPTSSVFESGLQQCVESDLDMILVYVPWLEPHLISTIIQGRTKKHPDKLDHYRIFPLLQAQLLLKKKAASPIESE